MVNKKTLKLAGTLFLGGFIFALGIGVNGLMAEGWDSFIPFGFSIIMMFFMFICFLVSFILFIVGLAQNN